MINEQKSQLDIAQIRAKLAEGDGAQLWRSLGELADTQEFQDFLHDEFPQQARPLRMEMDRRQFLVLSSASLALAGLSGCRVLPQDKIVPYVKAPEEILPGRPLHYASASLFGGYARGILVESHEGRPTKIEGNPDHAASLGSTDAFTQAEILSLYDADRSKNVMDRGSVSTWESFLTSARKALADQKTTGGKGLQILTETVTSPTLANQITRLLKSYPQAKWRQYEPVNTDSPKQGAQLAFGQLVNTQYDFSKAERVLSLDSDFLVAQPGSVRYARDFAQARRVTEDNRDNMSRVYALESTPKVTGTSADHRLPVRASDVEAYTRALAVKLGVAGVTAGELPASIPQAWVDEVADDLAQHKGRSVVVPGETQTPTVHALTHAINTALGNVGATVIYTDPVEENALDQLGSLRELMADIQAGEVQFLLILGANPVYHAPADLNFEAALLTVGFSVHHGLHFDETGGLCVWHLPATHFLEAWGDARAYDGTASVIQPLINPIFENCRSSIEVLSGLMNSPLSGFDMVQQQWQGTTKAADFRNAWGKILNDGMVPGTASPAKTVAIKADFAATLPYINPAPASKENLEIIFAPDPTVWDGRYANNGWLQELPKPMTKLTWDNAVLIGPALAEELKLQNEEVVELEVGGKTVQGPVWISLGHAKHAITVHLGYGRTRGGTIAAGGAGVTPGEGSKTCGFNAYKIRSSSAPWFTTGVSIKKMGGSYPLATTENHHIVESGKIDSQFQRDIIRVQTIEDYRAGKSASPEAEHGGTEAKAEHGAGEHGEKKHEQISMYPDIVGGPEELGANPDAAFDYSEFNKWGMVIDLNTCIGCSACTIACQAENNIPIVGKDLVMRGREMHWIRIDRYYKGDIDNPQTYFQPLGCVHCELAPCEPVCPVAATIHSHDGLNQMVYNRCIGTKYCSNNCPYKVRRFNFLNYASHFEQPFVTLSLARNPDVTVRHRGVMEKCSYCVQRISRARIEAKKENRPIKDGEVVTACQQACPTQAIVFGDLHDETSVVAKARKQPQNYILLEEINTRPRTTFMNRLHNPNPKMAKES